MTIAMTDHSMLLESSSSAESVKTVAETIACKIQQGHESVLPAELDQLRSVFLNQQGTPIPYLDRNYLQSGNNDGGRVTLVRYRGMVQDMLDSEFYVSEVDGIKTKYRDYCGGSASSIAPENMAQYLEERQLLVVVPVPFATTKVPDEPSSDATMVSTASTTTLRGNKRSLETPQSPGRRQPVLIRDSPTMDTSPTNVSTQPINAIDWWPAGCMGSDPNQCPVLAKIYSDENQKSLKLNQVVDMIGVLSLNPMDATFDQQDDDGMCTVLPPPSLLPRLHVLCYNPVDLDDMDASCEEPTAVGKDSRSLAINAFSKNVFDGNDTAAEALLMVLLSLAERQDSGIPLQATEETTLGCASLNMVLKDQEACNKMQERLQKVLKDIVPVVAVLKDGSLTVPSKNESGRLVPSVLQLPKGSVLVVNQGNAVGQAILSSLTKSHVVPYTFEGGMQYNFEADIRIIVLSCRANKKPLVCSMSLSVSPQESESRVSPEETARIRSYLSKCRSAPSPHGFNNIMLSKTVLEQAQEDFVQRRVQQRQQQRPEVGEDDFHRWLTIVRLEARSRVAGFSNTQESHCASVEDWQAALRLDDAMRSL